MIDIHSHILPEVDDGAKTWEIAQAMCRLADADGISHMVATPHANDRYAYDRAYLSALLSELQTLIGESPRLILGCDFHLSYDNLQDALKHPANYAIGNTNYLLVELSNYSVPAQVADCFAQLAERGLTPILTHPERNPILQASPQRVLEWVTQGCVVQLTAGSLTGNWGEQAWRTAEWLLKREAVHVLASDAHDTQHRPPVLSHGREAAADICGEEIARVLVEDNPRAIVSGQPLAYSPKPVMKS